MRTPGGFPAVLLPCQSRVGGCVAEQLHQYARVHEIVPVESWRKDGVEGWLFRDRENQTIFVETAELMREQAVVEFA